MFYVRKKDLGLFRITIGCPHCGGRSKKYGWVRGKRRYLCLACRRTFGRQRHLPINFSDFIAFYHLIIGYASRRQLIKEKSVSRPTLSVRFKPLFARPLTAEEVWQMLPSRIPPTWTYGVDGKWLKRSGVLILHRNITNGENLYWSFHLSESHPALMTDMVKLIELLGGKLPAAAVSDWKGAMVSAVAAGFGHIPHQRCLIHVERTAKVLLPQRSPLIATLQLRKIARKLVKIDTWPEVYWWFDQLGQWHDQYGYLLKERTKGLETKRTWWYTHGNLRRAWRLLTDNPRPFFRHLDNAFIPLSNNSLEGTFSQAINKLINHRGMKLTQQVSFLFWYLAFGKVKNRLDLKHLWDYWRRGK